MMMMMMTTTTTLVWNKMMCPWQTIAASPSVHHCFMFTIFMHGCSLRPVSRRIWTGLDWTIGARLWCGARECETPIVASFTRQANMMAWICEHPRNVWSCEHERTNEHPNLLFNHVWRWCAWVMPQCNTFSFSYTVNRLVWCQCIVDWFEIRENTINKIRELILN